MSEQNELAANSRRVVYSVCNNRNNQRKRFKRRDNNTSENGPCSVELQRAISAVIEYGKQAHIMGAIRALNLLQNIAVRLRTIALEPRSDELQNMAEQAEIAISEIRKSLNND